MGTNWPIGNNNAGPVSVTIVSKATIDSRVGTPWQIVSAANDTDYVFEVTFQDEVQATGMTLSVNTNTLTRPKIAAVADLQVNPAGVAAVPPQTPAYPVQPAVYDLKLNPASLPTVTAQWDLQLSLGTGNVNIGGNGNTTGELCISVNNNVLGQTQGTTFVPTVFQFSGVASAANLRERIANRAAGLCRRRRDRGLRGNQRERLALVRQLRLPHRLRREQRGDGGHQHSGRERQSGAHFALWATFHIRFHSVDEPVGGGEWGTISADFSGHHRDRVRRNECHRKRAGAAYPVSTSLLAGR